MSPRLLHGVLLVLAAAVSAAASALAEDHPAARVALVPFAVAGTVRGEAAIARSAAALRRSDDRPASLAWLAAARATDWKADEGSIARHRTAALIDRLEF